jgi:hypothetical protein
MHSGIRSWSKWVIFTSRWEVLHRRRPSRPPAFSSRPGRVEAGAQQSVWSKVALGITMKGVSDLASFCCSRQSSSNFSSRPDFMAAHFVWRLAFSILKHARRSRRRHRKRRCRERSHDAQTHGRKCRLLAIWYIRTDPIRSGATGHNQRISRRSRAIRTKWPSRLLQGSRHATVERSRVEKLGRLSTPPEAIAEG